MLKRVRRPRKKTKVKMSSMVARKAIELKLGSGVGLSFSSFFFFSFFFFLFSFFFLSFFLSLLSAIVFLTQPSFFHYKTKMLNKLNYNVPNSKL